MKSFNMPELKESPPQKTVEVSLTNNDDALYKAKPYQLERLGTWQLKNGASNMTTITTSGT